ncbi:MAG: hypothetical protein ACI8YQ_002183 [Polaribacter sp.]|jgi:hypothetical protein
MDTEEMSTGQKIKYGIYALIAMWFIYSFFIAKPTPAKAEYEEVATPTQGIATILQEVNPEEFKIEDEINLASSEDSYIVAKYLDTTIDTFTLAEVQLMSENPSGNSPRNSSMMRVASYGFFGYMMGRSMSSPVRSSAYMDQKTYNKVNKNTGNKMRSTAKRTSRAKPAGKSGYGSGKSSRSYGG